MGAADTAFLEIPPPDGLFAPSSIVNVDASTLIGGLTIELQGDETATHSVTVSKVGPEADVTIDGGNARAFATIGLGRLDQIQHDVTVLHAALTVDNSMASEPSIFTLDGSTFSGWSVAGGTSPEIHFSTLSAFTADGGPGDRFDVEAT